MKRFLSVQAALCLLSMAVWSASASCEKWVLSTTLTNPAPEAVDSFGFAVAEVDAGRTIIGAHLNDTGAMNAGAAYLFGPNGTLLTTFTNPTPEADDAFGIAVAGVNANTVVIGAWRDDTGARDAGAAYLFSASGTLLTTLTNPTPEVVDYFGRSVAGVGTNAVLIGAYLDKTGAFRAGAAYLFSVDGTLLTTFTNPFPQASDYFGFAVAGVDAERVLIGAARVDTGATNAGVAYLFSTDGTLLATFTNPTPGLGDRFGSALAGVGPDKVLIGAQLADTGARDAGAAYLFSTNGTLLTTYTNPTPQFEDYFGQAVAGVGVDKLLIGASGDRAGAKLPNAGAAYLFSIDGTLLTTFTNPTPEAGNVFGSHVAGVGADTVLIGSPNDNTGGSDAGAAYLYEVQPSPIHYVNINNAFPSAPYTNWATAATNIQDAVDAACAGDTVLVTNGVYATGGRAIHGTMTNRVAVDKPLTLLSVNGPGATIIEGRQVGPDGVGNGAIRCVALTNGSRLIGFTLTNGATRTSGRSDDERSGGAIYGYPFLTQTYASNCVIVGNAAQYGGGGATRVVLDRCLILSNSLTSSRGGGGGASSSVLFNCVIEGNSAMAFSGGGVSLSSLEGCLLLNNTAVSGGGAYRCSLYNCTVVGNSATVRGGGVYRSRTLANSIVYFNAAPAEPNHAAEAFRYSCTTPMPYGGTGNITNAPLFIDTNNWADLRLRPDSPCIDAGNNDFVTWDTDLDGNPRIINGIVDMGAYEFVPLSPAELVQDLIDMVTESDLPHKRPLLATLEAALASIERDSCHSAEGQLGAFRNKVSAQVTNLVLARELIAGADQVITALDCDGSPRVAARIHSLKRHPNGRMQMKMRGPAGKVYIVEASTNLVDWEAVGAATVNEDGLFEFEDDDEVNLPCRFYRVVER